MNTTDSMTSSYTVMHNGYATSATQNVAMWVLNDEFLFNTAKACVEFANPGQSPWAKFVKCMMQGQIGRYLSSTPDGVAWDSAEIDTRQMEQLMANLRSGY